MQECCTTDVDQCLTCATLIRRFEQYIERRFAPFFEDENGRRGRSSQLFVLNPYLILHGDLIGFPRILTQAMLN